MQHVILSKTNEKGFTFLEILLAVAVGAIVLAGIYASYLIVARQYTRLVAVAEVQEAGLPTLHLVMRDIRMAGYRALDNNLVSPFGPIATPITLTDSGGACCDTVSVIYDKDTATRLRVTYLVQSATSPTRNVLYMTKETWNGTAWITTVNKAPVADYIEDMQFVGSNPDSSGIPRLIDMSMIFKSKTAQLQSTSYQKPVMNAGNFGLTANDAYFRDEFIGTVRIKNMW